MAPILTPPSKVTPLSSATSWRSTSACGCTSLALSACIRLWPPAMKDRLRAAVGDRRHGFLDRGRPVIVIDDRWIHGLSRCLLALADSRRCRRPAPSSTLRRCRSPIIARSSSASAGEARLRQAADAEPGNLEQVAGAELRLDLAGEHVVHGRVLHPRHRGHVDLVQPVAAESEAGDVADRHADPPLDRAVGA